MTDKQCRICQETKPNTEFYQGKVCKACIKRRSSEYYYTHREKKASYRKNYLIAHSNKEIVLSEKQIKRFWSHVDTKEDVEACWVWKAAHDQDGYGTLRIQWRTYHASRIAWLITNGNPGNLKVLHTCDNRECCNPKHLFLGTNKTNSEDMARKGRSAKGEKNGNHKLTDEQINEIRRLYSQGNISFRALARQFNVNHGHIAHIIRLEART